MPKLHFLCPERLRRSSVPHRRRRRFGPGSCRSVSSFGFALLRQDNELRSACPASASISGCVRRLSYACKPSLLTHGTPRPSARSFPDFGHALAIRPLNGVYCLAGPRDNSSPYPCRISRFGRSKCDWGWESGLSEGPYFISMPTSLGLRTTFFGSIFAMWSFAAEPSP